MGHVSLIRGSHRSELQKNLTSLFPLPDRATQLVIVVMAFIIWTLRSAIYEPIIEFEAENRTDHRKRSCCVRSKRDEVPSSEGSFPKAPFS